MPQSNLFNGSCRSASILRWKTSKRLIAMTIALGSLGGTTSCPTGPCAGRDRRRRGLHRGPLRKRMRMRNALLLEVRMRDS